MASKKTNSSKFSWFLNNPVDFTLVIIVLILLCLGLIMVLSASSPKSLSEYGTSYQFFVKQLIFAILGLIAMAMISKIDYRFYKTSFDSINNTTSTCISNRKRSKQCEKMDRSSKWCSFCSTIRIGKILNDSILCRNAY